MAPMQDGSASRRGFFLTGLAAGVGALLVPGRVKAAVSKVAVSPRRVAELPSGKAQIGRVAFELNETARFIYERCDGARGVDDIAREVGAAYEVPLDTARTDVVTCIAQLREMGLVQ